MTTRTGTPADSRKVVLTVEDDRNLLATLEYNLLAAGYDVLTAQDGASALETARANQIDVIILDLGLPVLDGIAVCKALRNDGDTVPIVMLTARQGSEPCVEGLDCGADDYMRKPFQVRELMARVQAHLRRAEMTPAKAETKAETVREHTLAVGNVHIDFVRRKATKDDRPIQLRPREFDILNCLASRRGRAVSRNQILADVWGNDYAGGARAVDVHVSMLRAKIEDDRKNPMKLVTVHGTGYRLSN